MIEEKQLYIIIGIIFVFFILYMIFLLMIGMIDKKLTGIKINIPKQDVVLGVDRFNTKSIENKNNNIYGHDIKRKDLNFETDYLNGIQGYTENEDEPYYLNKFLKNKKVDHDIENNVCCLKHQHDSENKTCTYGRTNFPNPVTMNGMDRKIFKSYYQDGMTLQDYINWLRLHEEDGDQMKIGYEHRKFLKDLKRGKKLTYIKGICPPPIDRNRSNDSAEFYQNLYKEDMENEIKNTNCKNINFTKLFNESGIQTRSPLDLTTIQDANNLHNNSIQPANFSNYTRMNSFASNQHEKPREGKMSATTVDSMTRYRATN